MSQIDASKAHRGQAGRTATGNYTYLPYPLIELIKGGHVTSAHEIFVGQVDDEWRINNQPLFQFYHRATGHEIEFSQTLDFDVSEFINEGPRPLYIDDDESGKPDETQSVSGLLTVNQVCEALNISRSTLTRMRADKTKHPDFPEPISVGSWGRRWRKSEIEDWMNRHFT